MNEDRISYEGDGRKIAYISGSITLNPQKYLERFAQAESYLSSQDFIVLNPAVLPSGMKHSKYLPINDAMIAQSDCLFLIPGWEESIGCNHEVLTAKSLGKTINFLPENIFTTEE